jgi:hypothetical protein
MANINVDPIVTERDDQVNIKFGYYREVPVEPSECEYAKKETDDQIIIKINGKVGLIYYKRDGELALRGKMTIFSQYKPINFDSARDVKISFPFPNAETDYNFTINNVKKIRRVGRLEKMLHKFMVCDQK